MRIQTIVCVSILSTCLSGFASAQTLQGANHRLELFGGIGWGHLFRVEDRTFGDRPNIAVGFGVELVPRVHIEFELNDTIGLTPESALCGAPPGITCVGTGHEGFRRARIATGNVLYFFSNGRAQPYVTGGIGTLWSKGVRSITFGGGNPWHITEQEFHERGLVWHIGTGVRVAVTPRVSIRPEFRIYDSTIQSRVNLNLLRGSVAVGYGW
jgi:opacity protein-like surface antigen